MDAIANSVTANKHEVQGFPSLMLFKYGSKVEYEGGRSEKELVSWLSVKSGPLSKHLTTDKEIDEFVESSNEVIKLIAYFEGDTEADKSYNHWIRAAKSGKLENYQLGHVTDRSLFGGHPSNSVICLKQYEPSVLYDEGEFLSTSIIRWVQSECISLIFELNSNTWSEVEKKSVPTLTVFYTQIDLNWRNRLVELGRKYKDKAMITFSENVGLAKRWGATGNVLPTAVMTKWVEGKPKFYVFDEETRFNTISVEIFLKAVLSGTYPSYKKSEPIPTDNHSEQSIVKIVYKNFEKVVYDKEKNVLVQYFSPTSGICTEFSPIYELAAKEFGNDKSIIFGKFDGTSNSLPEDIKNVDGYPTIIFYPINNKSGIVFEGNRDFDTIVSFVNEHKYTYPSLSNIKKSSDNKDEL
eukprot:TRINITY_DN477_c0_g1_i5.p1 TRINITY_DN477_c0_g1~~TRINITY_DN477_c0_g1_i5.p1  ORF type:complete len:409 (-),score=59.64 TRINITY_DN477_c0_g1_i5:48-1274(-)